MEAQLETLLETITMNIGYPVSPENLQVLLDYTFYMQTCAIIFPELNIKIFKISEESPLTPAQKMQKLLELLTQELQINLAALSGQEILKGHFIHIFRFLKVLKQFSQAPPLNTNFQQQKQHRRIQSFAHPPLQQETPKMPQSARDESKQRNLSVSGEKSVHNQKENEEAGNLMRKQIGIKQTTQNMIQLQGRGNPMNIQEGKSNKPKGAESKEMKNKKIRHQVLRSNQNKSNKKQKGFIQNLMKSSKNKKIQQKYKKNIKSRTRNASKKDFEEIDNFFEAFQLKIRDQKQRYLRKMKTFIIEQENERLRLEQKIYLQREKQKIKRQKLVMESLMGRHKNNRDLIIEKSEANKGILGNLKKDEEKMLRESKKKLKEKIKAELSEIKNYIVQQNNKILMKLEENGQLQKMVLDFYKKF